MHSSTLKQYRLAKSRGMLSTDVAALLTSPHQFHVSAGVVEAARTIGRHEFAGDDEPRFPENSRLPAGQMVLSLQMDDGPVVVALRQRAADVVAIVFAEGVPQCIGSYFPGRREARSAPDGRGHEGSLAHIAFCVSLLNEPRRVTANPVTGVRWSKEQRAKIRKITGRAALAYSVVSWEVGSGVRAKGGRKEDASLRVALHWCRGHWRRAESHHPKSVWVQPFVSEVAGWYTWVAGCWKGHPDFGIKLQKHEARMQGERRSSPPADFSGNEKLQVMGAQQRRATAEAGFAPTSKLQ